MIVYFNSAVELGGSLETDVDFSLGNAVGVNVSSLDYSISFSSAPLALQPVASMSTVGVGDEVLADGTEDDPNEFGDAATQPATDYVGAPAATGIGARGAITGSETNVPKINEAVNGCAPGAAARSIQYMAAQGLYTITNTPQGTYGALTNAMQTTTNGTSKVNLISGKNAFVGSNGLPIATTFFTNNFGVAINTLNKTGDVELGISWGFSLTNTPSGVRTNFGGGHAVFVSQIIPITNAAGQIVRYQVRYIEDSIQGDSIASNNVKTMTVTPGGLDVNSPTNVVGRGIFGFFIENPTTVPEPSTLAMAAMGMIAAVLVRRRRR